MKIVRNGYIKFGSHAETTLSAYMHPEVCRNLQSADCSVDTGTDGQIEKQEQMQEGEVAYALYVPMPA